jgi:hypothetical protein
MPDIPYTSFGQGLIGGVIDSIQRRQQRDMELETGARQNALKWLQSIPMSKQNAPIITKMALEVLSSKPGKKHWTDQIFGTGAASNKFVDDLWAKLQGILPPPGEPEPSETANASQDFVMRPSAQTPMPRIPMPTDSPLGPPNSPQMISASNLGSAAGRMMNAIAPDLPPQMALTAQTRTTQRKADPTKISFDNIGGDWRVYPREFYDEQGNAFTVQYDPTGLQEPRIHRLGKVSTDRYNIAELNAQSRQETAEAAAFREQTKVAAQLAGYAPEVFKRLSLEEKAPYYAQAGQILAGQQLDKRAAAASKLNVDQSVIARNEAQAGYYGGRSASNNTEGLTPAQVESNYQQNLAAARKYIEEYEELRAVEVAAKQALDAHEQWAQTTTLGKVAKQNGLPDYTNKAIALQQAYTKAAASAQNKLAGAAAAFPGLLSNRNGQLVISAKSPVAMRTPTTNPPPITVDIRGSKANQPGPPAIGETRKLFPFAGRLLSVGEQFEDRGMTFIVLEVPGAAASTTGPPRYTVKRVK